MEPHAHDHQATDMLTPKSRGSLSELVFSCLTDPPSSWNVLRHAEPDDDDDLHITLWTLYELHHRGFDDVDDDLEWHPSLLRLRRRMERSFERELRGRMPLVSVDGPFEEALSAYIAAHDGASIADFVRTRADRNQALDFLRMRSVYALKESDPTTWVVPRLGTVTKAALMELQFDEYGNGDPNRLHAELFARGLEACGLRSEYGAYVDDAPTEVLAQNNAVTMFGLHRRLRGAALGHLAAFEATSSLPSRHVARGLGRLGLAAQMIGYYEEHIVADAVHEQLALRTICGSLVAEEPALMHDVFFGAHTCLDLEDRLARRVLAEWAA